MADIFLGVDEVFPPVGGTQTVFGNTGNETFKAQDGTFTFDATVETVHLPGNVADFNFQTVGTGVEVVDANTGDLVATFNDLSNAPTVLFGDGSTTLTAPTEVGGSAQIGGTDIPTDAPTSVTPNNINPDETSDTADGGTTPPSGDFELTQSVNNVDEGNSVTYTVETQSDLPDGATLAFTVSGDNLNGAATAADPSSDISPQSGSVTFSAGASAGDTQEFTIDALSDTTRTPLRAMLSVRSVLLTMEQTLQACRNIACPGTTRISSQSTATAKSA